MSKECKEPNDGWLVPPEKMSLCRFLLGTGWSLEEISKRILGCKLSELKIYIKNDQVLKRMIEDGLFLASQPLGQYIAYLLSRLERLKALGYSVTESEQSNIDYLIAHHSIVLKEAIRANEACKVHYNFSSFPKNLGLALKDSFQKNKDTSWIKKQIQSIECKNPLFPYGLFHGGMNYNHDLSEEKVFQVYHEYTLNIPAILDLGVLIGDLTPEIKHKLES